MKYLLLTRYSPREPIACGVVKYDGDVTKRIKKCLEDSLGQTIGFGQKPTTSYLSECLEGEEVDFSVSVGSRNLVIYATQIKIY